MNDNTKIVVAVLAGVAAGAALGLLFAPESGSETRDKLNDALKNLSDNIKDRAAEEIENLTAFKEKVVGNAKTKFASTEEGFNSAAQQQAPLTEQI